MTTRRWLMLSLALNLALGGIVLWAAHRRDGAAADRSIWRFVTNRTVRVRRAVIERPPQVVEVSALFHWSEVESSDYRIYLANLRGIGCPERTIRDIVVADVNELFTERLRELLRPLHASIWQILADFENAKKESDQYEKSWEALKNDREAVFKELFGNSNPFEADEIAERATDERSRQLELLDFLSPEKREAVMALVKQHDEARSQIWVADHSLTTDERNERQKQQQQLETERDRQLAALLSPGELDEYRLRLSSGAGVRGRLTAVEFSENELRAIARLTNEREQAEASIRDNSQKSKARREEIQRRADSQIKDALGAERYPEYERASDYRFDQISKVSERFNLSGETTLAVYEMQRTAQAQAKLIQANKDFSAEQRQALLQAISDETKRSIGETLGGKAFAAYEKNGGDWISSLVSPAN